MIYITQVSKIITIINIFIISEGTCCPTCTSVTMELPYERISHEPNFQLGTTFNMFKRGGGEENVI